MPVFAAYFGVFSPVFWLEYRIFISIVDISANLENIDWNLAYRTGLPNPVLLLRLLLLLKISKIVKMVKKGSRFRHLKACLGPALVTVLDQIGPPLALRSSQF